MVPNALPFTRAARSAALLLVAGSCAWLSGCSTLPSDGPRASQVQDEYQGQGDAHPFQLVDINVDTIRALAQRADPALAAGFGDELGTSQTAAITIGRGDGIAVAIWEVGSDTLFSSTPVSGGQQLPVVNSSRGANIPEQIVGSDGCISIPFAGRLPVAGRTPMEAQREIEEALAGKAQKPQVLVNVSRNISNAVTVVGEVTNGARVPLSTYGERLLDVLAAAGGIRVPTYETRVQITRGQSSLTMPLRQVLDDPRENIRMQPGDDLIVTRQPETYTAFGATGHNAQITFDAARVSLTEAIAKAGGLQDSRADPKGVFLFRLEPQSVASTLGTVPASLASNAQVPVVYRLDLSKAGSYFLAQNFDLRDHDILYVSNASTIELEKFLFLVGLVTQPVFSGAVLETSVK